ncbi:MAG TPA: PEP/pyruvate-binding domain-containing protein, partial [Pilimelia sp.]|nr:PEP/pyruvate-binding domain-containing protein [Pilimelia sp.]
MPHTAVRDAAAPTTGPLTAPASADPAFAGGKGAQLARLARAGFPVPAGFVVATGAYRRLVEESGIAPVLARAAAAPEDPAAAAIARRAVRAGGAPPWLRDAVADAYRSCGGGPVAVRSSATAEDLPEASFAGQLDSFLPVTGADAVVDAVLRCMASLWNDRAVAYRRQHLVEAAGLAVAVVVQQMVPADAAGVLFTADPVSGRRDRVVVEAAAGLGAALVGGHRTPQRWVLDAGSLAVRVRPDAPPVLDEADLTGLAALGQAAAALLGGPQDVEWAVAGGRCWVLQARPVTTLFPVPAGPAAGLRVYVPLLLLGQGIAAPLTPAGTAFLGAMVGEWLGRWIGLPSGVAARREAFPVLAGRLFGDVTPVLGRRRWAAGVVRSLALKDPVAGEVLREWLRENGDRLPAGRPPWGLVALLPALAPGLVAACVAPARARRRALAASARALADLTGEAQALDTPGRQGRWVARRLPRLTLAMIMPQLPLVYVQLLAEAAAARLVRRWTGSAEGLAPVLRWRAHDPTVAMGVALADLASRYATAGRAPAPDDAAFAAFLARYGHRAPEHEIDIGVPRLAEDPRYARDVVAAHLRAPDPHGALARARAGAAQSRAAAAALIADVRRRRGLPAAALLRALLHRLRELGGLRERPKSDMVRAIAVGRRTLRAAGAALAEAGVLAGEDDIFHLDAAQLAALDRRPAAVLRAAAAAQRARYARDCRRRQVPRLLTSEGEARYGPARAPAGLSGTPVAPGVAEGAVRVLHSPVGAP